MHAGGRERWLNKVTFRSESCSFQQKSYLPKTIMADVNAAAEKNKSDEMLLFAISTVS